MTVDNRGQNYLVIPVIAEGAKQHGSPKIQMFVILAEDELARRARAHNKKINRLGSTAPRFLAHISGRLNT